MGEKRMKGRFNQAYSFKGSPAQFGFRSAYYSEEGPPLIRRPRRKRATSVRSQREVGRLNDAFSAFYRVVITEDVSGKKLKTRHDTEYDLHRDDKYWTQTRMIESSFMSFLEKCSSSVDIEGKTVRSLSVLDIGCGTGKLMRRLVRTDAIMPRLEAGEMRMRVLGVDFNPCALSNAATKKKILFEHHEKLKDNLEMEFLLLDLLDLKRLDLTKTCIHDGKVDLVLASDIFRWIKTKERYDLLQAVLGKLKSSGYMISMEFTHPPLPPEPHLSRSLAMRLGAFTFFEPMQLGDLYGLAEAAGFERYPDSKSDAYQNEADPFPPLVSMVFAPWIKE